MGYVQKTVQKAKKEEVVVTRFVLTVIYLHGRFPALLFGHFTLFSLLLLHVVSTCPDDFCPAWAYSA